MTAPKLTADRLKILGRAQAVAHFEKGQFLDSPNEEITKWLDKQGISPGIGEFDPLYDAYCEGFRSYHVERWIAGLTLEESADLRQRLALPSPVAAAASGVIPGHVDAKRDKVRSDLKEMAKISVLVDEVEQSDSEKILERYLRNGPDWLQHAFNNDAAVNRVLKECAIRSMVIEHMWPKLAARLYELKNSWEETAMNHLAMQPSPPVVISANLQSVPSDSAPSTSARDALLVECREALEPCVGHLRWAADPSMKPSKGVRQIYREQADKIESLLSKLPSSVQ